jgi:antitoxin (DNA-binding transcriptional repressor) of toxin-antitoxin stability system
MAKLTQMSITRPCPRAQVNTPPASVERKSNGTTRLSRGEDTHEWYERSDTVKKVDDQQAKTHFSLCLEEVERGETIVICRRNEPIAEIKPIGRRRIQPRPTGLARGTFVVPHSFFRSLPEELIRDFEGRGG